jgi:single-strand DNA-binding protein
MASVNKAIIIGNLGAKPELRYTASGQAVTTLSVATNEKWKNKDGEPQERTEWHRVNVWGRSAENCEKYLDKGRQVYIEGRIQTRSWEDQDGNKRYTTEIVAQTVQFLSGDGRGADFIGGGDPNAGRAGGGGGGGGRGKSSGGGGFDDSFNEDDIPF